jgi:hypothetical protein
MNEHAQHYPHAASNSWNRVWDAWKDHPSFIRTSDRLVDDQCYGCATQLNIWIRELLEENAKLKEDANSR